MKGSPTETKSWKPWNLQVHGEPEIQIQIDSFIMHLLEAQMKNQGDDVIVRTKREN